jgi:hypothetical protein
MMILTVMVRYALFINSVVSKSGMIGVFVKRMSLVFLTLVFGVLKESGLLKANNERG